MGPKPRSEGSGPLQGDLATARDLRGMVPLALGGGVWRLRSHPKAFNGFCHGFRCCLAVVLMFLMVFRLLLSGLWLQVELYSATQERDLLLDRLLLRA